MSPKIESQGRVFVSRAARCLCVQSWLTPGGPPAGVRTNHPHYHFDRHFHAITVSLSKFIRRNRLLPRDSLQQPPINTNMFLRPPLFLSIKHILNPQLMHDCKMRLTQRLPLLSMVLPHPREARRRPWDLGRKFLETCNSSTTKACQEDADAAQHCCGALPLSPAPSNEPRLFDGLFALALPSPSLL